jgi:hypothetical protein
MSTRRARIKAVTSLPPRRKNIDNVDKSKQSQIKDESQKSIKSPSTPRSLLRSQDAAEITIKSPPVVSPLQNTSYSSNKTSSPKCKTTSETPKIINTIKTPKLEKIVIPSTAPLKPVFASPEPKTDSPIRCIVSPLVSSVKTTPRSKINTNKLTPQRSKATLKDVLEDERTVKSVHEKENSVIENKSDIPDGKCF